MYPAPGITTKKRFPPSARCVGECVAASPIMIHAWSAALPDSAALPQSQLYSPAMVISPMSTDPQRMDPRESKSLPTATMLR